MKKPKVRVSNKLPKDWKQFIAGDEMSQLLRKIADYTSTSSSDIRWHFRLKIRAYRKEPS